MGQGSQSKALRIANQTQYGFDATKIYDQKTGEVVGDIGNFDKAPDLWNRAGTGTLPQGTPDSFPDSIAPDVAGTILSQPPFNVPEPRENADNRSSGSNPFPTGSGQ